MVANKSAEGVEPKLMPARDMLKALAPYRKSSTARSIWELVITVVPFIILWIAAWKALSVGYWLTLLLTIPTGGFLVRFFLIQHDCGHAAFFPSKKVNEWVGRILGVFTMTPYDNWRRSHAIHHASSGNLDERGVGDIDTMTVREYNNATPKRKFFYRLYRSPIVLFVIGPGYQFLLRNRFPFMFDDDKRKYWISVMGTNISIAVIVALVSSYTGFLAFISVQIPVVMVAASAGVWMFYVQHQFENTSWEGEEKWQMYEAAMMGSSHYDLPAPLRWLTANIGIHHVHHLASRIPYYNLSAVLRDFPELVNIRRLTLLESFSCIKLRLWDEDTRKLVTFDEAAALAV